MLVIRDWYLIANGLSVRISTWYVWCSAVGVWYDQSSLLSIHFNLPLGYNSVVGASPLKEKQNVFSSSLVSMLFFIAAVDAPEQHVLQ